MDKSSTRHYALDEEHNVIPLEGDFIEVAQKAFTNFSGEGSEWRIVARDFLDNKIFVSTVFLVIDHNWNPEIKEPLVFETMVFYKNYMRELDMARYSTWDEAEQGHNKIKQKWEKYSQKEIKKIVEENN